MFIKFLFYLVFSPILLPWSLVYLLARVFKFVNNGFLVLETKLKLGTFAGFLFWPFSGCLLYSILWIFSGFSYEWRLPLLFTLPIAILNHIWVSTCNFIIEYSSSFFHIIELNKMSKRWILKEDPFKRITKSMFIVIIGIAFLSFVFLTSFIAISFFLIFASGILFLLNYVTLKKSNMETGMRKNISCKPEDTVIKYFQDFTLLFIVGSIVNVFVEISPIYDYIYAFFLWFYFMLSFLRWNSYKITNNISDDGKFALYPWYLYKIPSKQN